METSKNLNRVIAGRLGGLKSKITSNQLKSDRIQKYLEMPAHCTQCNAELIYDKRYNKFCSKSCSAQFINKDKKKSKVCIICNAPRIHGKQYCSNNCQSTHAYQTHISNWKQGIISGLNAGNCVTEQVKKYLRDKYENKCCLCGWSKVNIVTGKVPLVADHIDGNYQNNKEENLRLICWNCDSIGLTFGNLNRGNGRKYRNSKE